ncbi:hypothetical protein [Streptomyces sioyaensis]|uniref:hypothetical protein n=1 Tax=Streptomyces sioyaensis TaxID=67364 RepID=UPI00379F14F9
MSALPTRLRPLAVAVALVAGPCLAVPATATGARIDVLSAGGSGDVVRLTKS